MTERLYYRDAYTRFAYATVLDARQQDKATWLLLDKTLFYPGGGGQPHDRGTINDFPVVDVKEKEGKIWHKIVAEGASFKTGEAVRTVLDWSYRFYQMQQHSGQHLLSAVLHEHGWPTVSVHLGDEHTLVEVETSGPLPEPAILKKIEHQAMQQIAKGLPIHIHWITREEANQFPLRRPPADFLNLRIVEIAGTDYSACGGTHVKNTAEIGLIKIIGVEKIRGHARVKALIGQRAFDYLEELHQTNLLLREKLNTDHTQFNERVTQLQENLSYLKRLNRFYRQHYIQFKSHQLAGQTTDLLIAHQLTEGEADDASEIARTLSKTYGKVAIIQFDRRFFLASPGPQVLDTVKFLRQHADSLEIKGGGPQGFCQGIMKQNNLEQIAEALQQNLMRTNTAQVKGKKE